jgi:replicative DNA helicase
MLLGRLMVFHENIELALEKGLKAEWFSREELRKVFIQMLEMYQNTGQFEISSIEISDELLDTLYDYGSFITLVDIAIRELKKEYQKDLFESKVKEIMSNEELTLEQKSSEIRELSEKINEEEDENYKILKPRNLLSNWSEKIEKKVMNGVRSPFTNMQKYFNFLGGQLIVIGARPSMGKTALGLTFFKETAKRHNCLFVNLEMNESEITERLLASEADVALNRLSFREQTDRETSALSRAIATVDNMKFDVLYCLKMEFEVIVNKIRIAHKKNPFKLIVIDYLTMMRSGKKFQNRNLEVEYMANALKMLSKKLNTCIIVLAQLNRSNEARTGKNKKPEMSDLRDSGGIEQAADIIGLLYREDYYDEEMKNEDFVFLEMLIRKNRQGRTGDITFGFQKSSQRISGGKDEN